MNSPEDVLEHAKFLFTLKPKTEIILRNVARNAYYALYHKLSCLELADIADTETDYGVHQLLINKLRMSNNEEYTKLGLRLATLKGTRVKADYKIGSKFHENDAYSSLRNVEKIFKSMNEANTEEDIKVEGGADIIGSKPNTKIHPALKVIKNPTEF